MIGDNFPQVENKIKKTGRGGISGELKEFLYSDVERKKNVMHENNKPWSLA